MSGDHEFKLGDRVCYVGRVMPHRFGSIGRIDSIDVGDDDRIMLTVIQDNGRRGRWFLSSVEAVTS